MYILNMARAIKMMSVDEIGNFIFENYYKRIIIKNTINHLVKEKQKIRITIKNNYLLTKTF